MANRFIDNWVKNPPLLYGVFTLQQGFIPVTKPLKRYYLTHLSLKTTDHAKQNHQGH